MKEKFYRQYKEAWDRKRQKEEEALLKRKSLLTQKVKLCAEKLRELGGKKVILFGSLATGTFRKNSDIDIAVEGLSVNGYFKALGVLEEIFEDIEFDLVDLKEALPSVLKKIEREGIQI